MLDFLNKMMGKMTSPKKGLEILRDQINEKLGKKVSTYSIELSIVDKKMRFKVEDTVHPFDSDFLFMIIESMVNTQVPEGATLLAASIVYNEKTPCLCTIYYNDNGVDKKETAEL